MVVCLRQGGEGPLPKLFSPPPGRALLLLKGAPSCPALTYPTALADLNTLALRADPGAQLPAIATQNWPWTWPTFRQM